MSNRPASSHPVSARAFSRSRLWLVGTGLTALTAVATAVIALRIQSVEAAQAATAPTAAPVSVAVVAQSVSSGEAAGLRAPEPVSCLVTEGGGVRALR